MLIGERKLRQKYCHRILHLPFSRTLRQWKPGFGYLLPIMEAGHKGHGIGMKGQASNRERKYQLRGQANLLPAINKDLLSRLMASMGSRHPDVKVTGSSPARPSV